jgi:hypothetical protein
MTLLFKNKKVGNLIEINGQQDVVFCSQGGGFCYSMRLDRLLADFELADLSNPYGDSKLAMVAGDWPNSGPFPCRLDNRRWNGWRIPYFDKTTFIIAHSSCSTKCYEGKGSDVIVVEDGVESIHKPTMQINGIDYYASHMGWCWEEFQVERHSSTQVSDLAQVPPNSGGVSDTAA